MDIGVTRAHAVNQVIAEIREASFDDKPGVMSLLELGIATPNEIRDRFINKKDEWQTNCKNCGAPLSPVTRRYGYLKCSYCGTFYEIDKAIPEGLHIVEHSNVDVLAVDCVVNDYYVHNLPEQELFEHVKRDLCLQLANKLLDRVTFMQETDFMHCNTKFRAQIRVVDKDFRF